MNERSKEWDDAPRRKKWDDAPRRQESTARSAVPHWNRSLQSRLAVGTACAVALMMALAGGAVYFLVRSSLLAELDAALTAKARAIAAVAEREGQEVSVEMEGMAMPEFSRRERPEHFQIWSYGSTTLGRSPSLELEDGQLAPHEDGKLPSHRFINFPDGRRGRALYMRFIPRQEETATSPAPNSVILAVARDTREFEMATRQTLYSLLAAGIGAAGVAAAVLTWVVRRGLSPLNVLAKRIAEIDHSSLSQRVDVKDAPRELAPVVERLNDLLQRLDAALARERAFTSDAAHELRTPLAGLATTLEVCASRPRERVEYQQAIARCLTVTRDMHVMIEDLLMLARADSQQLPVSQDDVDLAALLRKSWRTVEAKASQRNLEVAWDVETAGRIQSDEDKLRVVANNLFDNAVSYADAGGRVKITAARGNGGVEVTVANSGSNLSPDEAQQAFERFWRKDAARSDAQHCGLGLSLCRRLMRALGGTIEVESEKGGVFRARVFVATASPA